MQNICTCAGKLLPLRPIRNKKIFDMKKIIQPNTVFECLSDWEIFSKVYLDENSVVSWNKNPSIDSNIEWSNKIDLCTDSLYVDSINI